jgi:signal peptidase I
MEPTLLIGDHVLADKTAYGWRLPFLDRPLSGPHMPRRGDIVVFPYPEDPSRMFLKRVIGLPGETVEIRDRVVHVDGKPLEEPYVMFLSGPADGDFEPMDGRDNWGPATLPAGKLFLLGDNRDNSKDSRYWGFLPVEDLRGRIRVIYYSIDERGTQGIRWGRIGREPR